jgi:Zn-dependent protease
MQQTFLPEQFSVQAVQAIQQANAMAARTRAILLSPPHLLYGLLAQKETDAVGVLTALGHDTEKMLRKLKEQFKSRQMVRWQGSGDKDQGRLDPALDRVLNGALEEARAVGVPFASTRDLLVSVLSYPTAEIAEWQQTWSVDVESICQAPVSVYEQSITAAAEQYEQAVERAREERRRQRVSPVFLGLIAAMIGVGVYLYQVVDPAPIAIFVFVTIGWVVSLALHEFGHALMAYIGGDYTVAERGYLTLNPLKYTHPVLSIVMPVIFLLLGGIGLPGGAVYVHMGAIRSRWMQSVVSAAGPAANGLFAIVLALPFLLISDVGFFAENLYFWSAIALLIFLQITAIVFNLLPMPGLDGFGILAPWLPMSIHHMLAPLYSFGYLLLIFLFWYVDAFRTVFWTFVWLALLELNVISELVEIGFSRYRFWT